jgi:histidyl-tRNA synthetase
MSDEALKSMVIEPIEALRGMPDVLPEDAPYWQWLEQVARAVFHEYSYREIRVPVLERTRLFKRAIGEYTDIVEKEMFAFLDRDNESVALRPEATASIVRAAISNGLLHNQRHRLYTLGPMFRGERPQKGRYRQFYQIDVEALGFEGPEIDAEMILLPARLFNRLGIDRVRLEINSLGTPQSRAVYREKLKEYFQANFARLDEDSRRRLNGNPLRILDTKNPEMADLISQAPSMAEYWDEESRVHFEHLKAMLSEAEVPFTVNPRLVRGLDYYSRTVFEWVTDALGSQNAVCSGGRYDGLIGLLGGTPTPAIGWALGMERIVLLMKELGRHPKVRPLDIYLILVGEAAKRHGVSVAEQLRTAIPGLSIEAEFEGGGFKAQFKRADKSGARFALIVGDDEASKNLVSIKLLREEGEQRTLTLADAIHWLKSIR